MFPPSHQPDLALYAACPPRQFVTANLPPNSTPLLQLAPHPWYGEVGVQQTFGGPVASWSPLPHSQPLVSNAPPVTRPSPSSIVMPRRDLNSAPVADTAAFSNLFVAPLPKSVRNDDLLAVFSPYGASHASVMMDVHTGRSKGFGFVSFDNPLDGYAAATALHQSALMSPSGEPYTISISVSHHKKSACLNEGRNVYFRNLPTNLPHDEIRAVLSQFGEISSIQVKLDNYKRWCLATVEYATLEGARNAVELGHGKALFPTISTFPVMVKFADTTSGTKGSRKSAKRREKSESQRKARGSATSLDAAPPLEAFPPPPESLIEISICDVAALHHPDSSVIHTLNISGNSNNSNSQREDPLVPGRPQHRRTISTISTTDTESSEGGGSTSGSSGKYRRNPYNTEAVTVNIE